MFCKRSVRFLASILFLACFSVAVADEIDIQLLIKDLNADKFSVRRAASQKLQEMGKAAFPALTKSAESQDREVASRSVEILRHHFGNGDDETKAEAKAALDKLAASDHAVAARLAKQALKPKEEPPQGIPGIPGGIQIGGGGRVQIQVRAAGGNNRKVSIKIANGVKEIDAEENGQKVKIMEDANGIKMQVTEKKDGKDVTKKYEAKNAADLKKNHPDAHKIYEKYGKGQGGIQFNIQGIQVKPGQFPALPIPKNGRQQFEQSKKNLERIIERYKKQIEQNGGNADALKKSIENLEKHIKSIEEIQNRVEKQRGDAEAESKKLEEQREQIKKALELDKKI